MGRWAADGRNIDYNVEVADIQSSGLVPTEEQAKYTPQDKTLSSVTIAAGGQTTYTANAINMDGFTKLGVGIVAGASHSFIASVLASPDASTLIGEPAMTKSATSSTRHLVGEVALNFAIIQLTNNDAASQTYNAWSRKYNG